MSCESLITDRDWETLRTSVLGERASGRRMASEATLSSEEYWQGYAAACDTIYNLMRRIDRRDSPPPIEDILTE